MKLFDLTKVIDPGILVCIEEFKTHETIYCNMLGDITMGEFRKLTDRTVKEIYPESYGKFCNRHGITIILES